MSRFKQRSLRPDMWSPSERQRLSAAVQRGGRRRDQSGVFNKGVYHQRNLISSYSCSLGWLADCDLLNWELDPAERWSVEVLERYIDHLTSAYARATVAHRLRYLERALATFDPSGDRELVKSALFRLGRPGRNTAKDSRVVLSDRLLQLGLDLMYEAEAMELSAFAAAHYRTGLQIALMAIVPWRIGEFSRLTVGNDDNHVYQMDGQWRIRISALETKNRVSGRDVPFPKTLIKHLKRYLSKFRETLGKGVYAGQALWLSTRAQQQGSRVIFWHFKKQTCYGLGEPLARMISAKRRRPPWRSMRPHILKRCCVVAGRRLKRPAMNTTIWQGHSAHRSNSMMSRRPSSRERETGRLDHPYVWRAP